MRIFAAIVLGLSLVCLPALGGCGGGGGSKDGESTRSSSKSKKSKRSKEPVRADNADAAYRKAIDAEADEDWEAAGKYYKLAIRKDPKHKRANQHYVHFLIDQGREERALKVAQKFFDDLPGQAVSYYTLADAEAANGKHERVIGTMSGLLAFNEEDATAFEIRGRARLKIGESELGIKDIRRAVSMEPDNSDFMISLAGGLMMMSKGKEARKVLNRALRANDRSSRAHLLLGLLSRGEGKDAEALKHHKAAVRLDSEDARAQYELGISRNRLGDDAGAEESFGNAIDLEPDNGNYWYSYGDLLRLRKRNEEAAAAYRKSVKLIPTYALAWERLAQTLIATGQLKDAAKQLKRGIGNVDHPRLYFMLGKVYKQAKKKKRAIEALENYLDAAPEDAPDRKAAKKLLDRLR
jgi:predicted Zn-dependent protease